MTKYEKWAIVISIIAILIPIVQWGWKKWIIKPKLAFYPTGRAFLFSNKSGSYIQIEGVYEALRKPISVKNVTAIIKRKKDGAMMDLRWSSFVNPANQQIMGAMASMSEIAHPFRIDADNVVCAFTEFADFYNSSFKTIQPYFDVISFDINELMKKKFTYEDAQKEYSKLSSYKEAKDVLYKEFFWKISKYEVKLIAEYKNRKQEFEYMFEVTKEQQDALLHNLTEVLDSCLKDNYGVPRAFKSVMVELKEI